MLLIQCLLKQYTEEMRERDNLKYNTYNIKNNKILNIIKLICGRMWTLIISYQLVNWRRFFVHSCMKRQLIKCICVYIVYQTYDFCLYSWIVPFICLYFVLQVFLIFGSVACEILNKSDGNLKIKGTLCLLCFGTKVSCIFSWKYNFNSQD